MAYLDIPGARLWYTDSGRPGDTGASGGTRSGGTGSGGTGSGSGGGAVVFVHPAAGSSASWVNQIGPFAAAGYRVITYDLRGWGKSTRAADAADAGYLSDDLEALVAGLGLERFCLVAAAYGGFGGLDYALRFQEQRLRALVLATTQGGLADPAYSAVLARVVTPEIRDLPLHLRELGPSYRAEAPDGVNRWLDILNQAGHSTAPVHQAPPRQAQRLQITLPMLETLRVPTLLLAADADLLAPPALMRLQAAQIPHSQFVTLPDAGHSAHWERPDEWNQIVLEFLKTSLDNNELRT